MSHDDFRPFVPASGRSNIAGSTPREHAHARMQSPRAQELFGTWAKLAAAPFTGITTNGHVEPNLFTLRPEEAPTAAMMAAVEALLAQLSPEQRKATCFPVDSTLWRHWQNTELYVEHHGLRLDEVGSPIQEAVMAVVRSSLSGKGYDTTRGVMGSIASSAISSAGRRCSANGPTSFACLATPQARSRGAGSFSAIICR